MHNPIARRVCFVLCLLLTAARCQEPQDEDQGILPGEFAPVVTAICRGGAMIVTVNTGNPFYGILHSSSVRSSPCYQEGVGSKNTQISFAMNAEPSDRDYCGIVTNNRTGEKSIQLAVRAHRTLELAEDRQYVVTCGKAGFKNNRNNDTWSVRMGFYQGQRLLTEVVQGKSYTLKVELSKSPEFAIRVRSCFAFGSNDTFVPLIDDSGCPEKAVMSRWRYSSDNQQAEATIYSMFKFADSKRVNIQCDVLLCQESQCPNPRCESVPALLHVFPQRQRDTNDTSVLVATAAYVFEPTENAELYTAGDCEGFYPKWLLWLAIVLGVLFAIMLIVNLFLCSALTCTCTRTELIEKEPSVLEDYDPYRSWAGSQYGGSRYSLSQGGGKPIYSLSAAESNGGSDHYATVPSRHSPSRPGSRYSNRHGGGPPHTASPYTSNNRKMMY